MNNKYLIDKELELAEALSKNDNIDSIYFKNNFLILKINCHSRIEDVLETENSIFIDNSKDDLDFEHPFLHLVLGDRILDMNLKGRRYINLELKSVSFKINNDYNPKFNEKYVIDEIEFFIPK
jgi:hypothetical protein